MYKRIAVFITAAVLAGFVAYRPFINPPKASAWTNSNTGQCPVDLNWDWKDKIKAAAIADDATTGVKWDVDSALWKGAFIYQTSAYVSANEVGVILLTDGTYYRMIFEKVSGSYQVRLAPGTTEVKSAYGTNAGVYEFKLNTVSKTASIVGLVSKGTSPTANGSTITNALCITTARGATYAGTFDAQQFSTVIPNQNTADCNGALDVACWVRKGFQGVGNAINDVAQAAFRLLASMFVPDGNNIKEEFDTFNSYMSTKLGFMLYPFDFINDMFNAFLSTSDNWCTGTSSCTRNFGNLFGRPLVVDIGNSAASLGSIWTYALAAIRGLTVLELILAIWKKTKAVTAK